MRDTCIAKPPCLAAATSGFEGLNLWMCVMHVSSAGTSSVEGHSYLPMSLRISMTLDSHVFSWLCFCFEGMCSSGETLCGFWWERVDSAFSFPATWSLRCCVCFISVCLWSFFMERQLARAAHPPCKAQKNIVIDLACAGRSKVAASVSAAGLVFHEQAGRENVQTLGSFQKIRTQMPRKLLVPRLDDVRKCLLICSEQEQANKSTRLTLNVFVAEGEDSRLSKFASCFCESLIFTFQAHRATHASKQ